ncbi:MAG: AsmA family protein [Acidiferrobacterales bacterium]
MKRVIKILAIVLGAFILGIIALAIILPLVIDPNDYKDEIIEAAKENTGRDLKIDGDLKLSVFPWLGVELAGVELANAPGFGQQPFARVTAAGVRVKLLPLLSKELVVDTILLDGLELNLMKNKAGVTNWDDLAGGTTQEPKANQTGTVGPAEPAIAALTVGGIRISNGKILWLDQSAGQRYALQALELKSGKIVPGKPVDLEMAFDLDVGDPPQRVRVGLDTRATLDVEGQTLDMPRLKLKIDELALKGNFKGRQIMEAAVVEGNIELTPFDPTSLANKFAVGLPPGIDEIGVKSAFNVDLGKQTLDVPSLQVRLNEMSLNAAVKGSKIVDAPVLQGHIEIPSFNPRPLVNALASEFVPTSKNALTTLALKSGFTFDTKRDTLALSGLALTVDEIALKANLKGSHLTDTAKLVASGDLEIPSFRPAALAALLNVELEPTYKTAFAKASLKTRFSADLRRGQASITNLALTADAVKLKATVRARQIQKAPQASGRIELAPLDARSLMKKLRVQYQTTDNKALAKVGLKTNFNASEKQLSLSKLDTTLDQSRLTGSLSVRNFEKPAYVFDLALNQIDLDRYLPPPGPAPKTGATPGAASPGAAAELPLDTLRDLNAKGQIRINKLKAFGIRSSKVIAKVNAKNGLIILGPNQAALYGGRYAGKTTVDARSQTPKFTIKEKLSRVKVGPFLTDAKIYDQLTGTGDLNLNVTGRGLDPDAVVKTLSGNLFVNLRNGEIKGIDLQKMVNDVLAFAEKVKGQRPSTKPKPTDSTKYHRFKATVKLKNGIGRNDDLDLAGPFLIAGKKQGGIWATGKGSADLVKQTINYRANVRAAEDVKRKGTTIPVDVAGTFAQPVFSPDWNAVIKAQVQKKLDQKVEKKKQEQKQALERKKEEKKKELEEDLERKLKEKFKLKF